MKIKDLLGLDSELLVKWMRDSGVVHLGLDGCSITLGVPPAATPIEPSRFDDEEIKLACGHPAYEGNELGECYHGCLNKPPQE